VRTQSEVVVLVAREPRQVGHDDEVNAALVHPAKGKQILELAAVGGLGALAFLVEAFEGLVALAATACKNNVITAIEKAATGSLWMTNRSSARSH
jgi:hypothetical protein